MKDRFYEDLEQIIRQTPVSGKLVILGDFNARVENVYNNWDGVLGRHGVEKRNSNGLLLLSKRTEHNLCIANTMFRQVQNHLDAPQVQILAHD